MKYHQLTSAERYTLACLRRKHYSQAEIARVLGRHPSTISRELRRNRRQDGYYRAVTACEHTRARRSRSRRNWQFTEEQWLLVLACLHQLWSPEQISGRLKRLGLLTISHETIYRYIWTDRAHGGGLHTYPRQSGKQLTEFHGYKRLEKLTGARIYFATPHHSWERGTSENTNGLIRQYLPQRTSMKNVAQHDCNRIAQALNNRPRKRLGFLTPAEVYERDSGRA